MRSAESLVEVGEFGIFVRVTPSKEGALRPLTGMLNEHRDTGVLLGGERSAHPPRVLGVRDTPEVAGVVVDWARVV